jgi:ParB/RepB/Spo0J family partition protein
MFDLQQPLRYVLNQREYIWRYRRMKIMIENIRPSPNPIRKSWDEEKMKELCWSLLEEGQVEPIGVYESDGGYTIVWGHRRVEAARRVGWNEIDTLIVPRDEIDNLIQSGIENLSGEDMTADDKAEWAQRLVKMGFSQHEIARRTSIPIGTINQWLQYRREKEAGVYVHVQNQGKDEGVIKTVKIAQALGDDLEAKKVVAAKVSAEGLTQIQTTEIARAYHDAPTPEVKQKIIASPVLSSDTAADILRRSIARVELDKATLVHETQALGKEDKRSKDQDFSRAVKQLMEEMQLLNRTVKKVVAAVNYGGYSQAALRYTIRKIDGLVGELQACKDHLRALE